MRDENGLLISSFCTDGDCVAVSLTSDGAVRVADTASDAPALEFRREQWDAFVAGVKAGEFDLDRG